MRCFPRYIRRMLRERFSTTGWSNDGINHALFKFVPHRRHAAEFFDDFLKGFDDVINIFLGIGVAERHDDVALRERVIEADGAEDVRNFQRLAHATGTAGHMGLGEYSSELQEQEMSTNETC